MPEELSSEAMDALEEMGITPDDLRHEADLVGDRELDDLADKVKAAWEAKAPVDTGFYRSDIVVKEIETSDGHKARRVEDMARYAHIIEYGSEHNEPRGVRAAVAQEFGNEGRYTL